MPFTVINPGSPGPAPTKYTTPVLAIDIYNIAPAPESSNFLAILSPASTGSEILSVLCTLYNRVPSWSDATEIRLTASPSIEAYAATGTLQPPPSAFKKARSAIKAIWVDWCCISFNKEKHEQVYNVSNFEKSITSIFGEIISKTEIDGPTRILYFIKVVYHSFYKKLILIIKNVATHFIKHFY